MPESCDQPNRLEEILEIQRTRWNNGNPLLVESLTADVLPKLTEAETLELIYAEIVLRTENPGSCDIKEYLWRFPALAEQLERLWSIHEFVEANDGDSCEPLLRRQEQGGLLQPDTIIHGRYRIVRVIGRGGMGAVYEAVDQRIGSHVALKQKLIARSTAAFEREAKILARLQHSGLPRVTDFFDDRSEQFLVMEFVAGENLAEMLARRDRPFDFSTVIKWSQELLRILNYLQAQHPAIVHRDIKPQNIKVRAGGGIVLLDFGLAKGGVDLTGDSMIQSVGGFTPAYAPLEQLNLLGTDPRSDIYSLGATLYHLVTGIPPVDAASRASHLLNRQPDPLVKASVHCDAIPSWFSDLLASMLTVTIAERAMNPDSVLAQIERGVRSEPLIGMTREPGRKSGWRAENPWIPANNVVVQTVFGPFPESPRLQRRDAEIPVPVSLALRRAQRIDGMFHNARIVWVDDHPEWVYSLCGILVALGASVDLVTSSSEAVRKINTTNYHVIISDIYRDDVPNEGERFLRTLQANPKHPALIFYIGNLDPSRGTPPGAFGITNSGDELLHLICDVLERHRW